MLARVDVTELVTWIEAIDFSLWPQQHRVDDQLRPAMVNDLRWYHFGEVTDALVREIERDVLRGYLRARPTVTFNRMLSVVMPGHSISPHVDAQEPDWLTRVHVPLVTNPHAVTVVSTVSRGFRGGHMEVGGVYFVDTRVEHAIRNDGDTPRIHFMFDVRRA